VILHLALRDDWDTAQEVGSYPWSTRGLTLDEVGYVHCSFEHQWRGVRNRFYADLADDELILLVVDESRLSSPVVVERLDDAPDDFPHVYGPLEISAVVATREVSRDSA
jgi:uncharacterized protein (DUF952 family)